MVVAAALDVPVLRKIVDVKFLAPSREKIVALPQESADFHTVTRKLCIGSHIRHSGYELYNRLYLKNYDGQFALEEGLRERNIIKTRVHAELQVVDYFSRKKLEFVGGDKYVGCSKPACYLCYRWISLHPGGFSLPASHKKVSPWMAWSGCEC
jgi:OTT_1508-like deaminase